MQGGHSENLWELVGFTWGIKSIMHLKVHKRFMEVGFLILAGLPTLLFWPNFTEYKAPYLQVLSVMQLDAIENQ